MKNEKNLVIWGAGKIGRGFLGDLAHRSGYGITFVDANRDFTDAFRRQGTYTLWNLKSENDREKVFIDDFTVLHTDDTAAVQTALGGTNLLALSIFSRDFEAAAAQIAKHLEERRTQEQASPLDIIICANMHHPGAALKKLIDAHLSEQGRTYFQEQVGIIETLVIRMAVQPTEEMLQEDPFVVMTNGYPQLTVDETAFRNGLPDIDGFRFTRNIEAEELRKMYTYNMVHAVYAYAGHIRNYTLVSDAAADPDIRCIAEGALDEISLALQKELGFSAEEMQVWNQEVLINMANPILKDRIDRVGADPKRKLARTDRLIGPALLCRKNGILPYYLSLAIASGYLFSNPEDAAALEIADFLKHYPLKEALRRYSGLETELDLMQLIRELHERVKTQGIDGVFAGKKRAAILKRAYYLGFKNELTIRGCAQCTVKALGELVGEVDSVLFKATSGYSGGIAITGDGSCGGYTGGVLCMGSYVGRRLEHLADGDKVAQYASFDMAQVLHDRYIDTYGSVTCSDIHKGVFGGKAYCLRSKAVRNDFEEAGAHLDKCTTVIAAASMWTTEILLDRNILGLDDIVLPVDADK